MFSVSQSKIKSWRTCHRKYYYAHVLELMLKKKPRPLMRGSIIHDMIEDKVEKRDPWKRYTKWLKGKKKMFREEEEYENLPEEITLLMEGYFRHYKKDPYRPVKNDGRFCEYPFEVPLTRDINLKGRIDGYARKDGLNWLIERKSHKTIPVSEFKFTDIQSGLYTWVAPQIGFKEPDGVLWDYVRAKKPTTPKLLASGNGLSQSAKIDTMWPVYEQAIKDNGFDVKDYKDMKTTLIGAEAKFFSRVTLPISPVFQQNLLEDTITTAKEIRRRAGKDKTRTVDKHCEWCSFNKVCVAGLMGLDTKFILENLYTESDYGK